MQEIIGIWFYLVLYGGNALFGGDDKLEPLSELALREFSSVGETMDLLGIQLSEVSENYSNLAQRLQKELKDMLRIPRKLSDPYVYYVNFTPLKC